jgi:hypothetical protein
MKITAQRLRNLTTQRLHTDMGCVYQDLAEIMGEPGMMTHMIPRAVQAVEPWLRRHLTDARFWDGEYDPSHEGDFDLPTPTDEDRIEMAQIYMSQPDPLRGKAVIGAVIGKGAL